MSLTGQFTERCLNVNNPCKQNNDFYLLLTIYLYCLMQCLLLLAQIVQLIAESFLYMCTQCNYHVGLI